ncbi:MAG: N-acetylneuraminate synthase [Bacteroidales bacterium]|nr:N-acetylneuraminate synthase [Bacteroidales bacterium]
MRNHVLIIAEAGVNHNGDFEKAKQLIDFAAIAGADYVKFQTFKADKLVSKSAIKADYQTKNLNDRTTSQYDMLKKLEMPEQWHYELIEYCKLKGIKFLSTGFDVQSIDFLDKIDIPFFKVPSGEITNKPYLQHIASKNKPVIVSTGMANLDEIRDCITVLINGGIAIEKITILHCNTEYPTPMEDVNLLAMNAIREAFGVDVGYSDHTQGIEIPIAAVALGATVIEKHFTLDRNLPGPDHKASLEPNELEAMVKAIRNIELAISGSGQKLPSKSEMKNKDIARKSLHVARTIPMAEKITSNDIILLRPGNGISPMKINEVIGMKAIHELDEGSILKWEDLE